MELTYIEKAGREFDRVSSDFIEKLNTLLKGYEFDITSIFADAVASLCYIDKETMFSDCSKLHTAQARWLYWYVIKHTSNETYSRIAEICASNGGVRYSVRAIGYGLSQMAQMIDTSDVWRSRWSTLKKIIQIKNASLIEDYVIKNETKKKVKIRITIPNDVELEIDKERKML